MTLLDFIQTLNSVALQQPQVNEVVENDIFNLNTRSNARYGVFGWTQGQHSATPQSDTITFRFNLFYVDRLAADKSNEIEVQSVGCQVLTNIINTLAAMDMVYDDYTLQPFTQRFSDECAGVYAVVQVHVPFDSSCEQTTF